MTLEEAVKTLHLDGFRARCVDADGACDIVVGVNINGDEVDNETVWRRAAVGEYVQTDRIRTKMLADAMCRFLNMGGQPQDILNLGAQFDQFQLSFEEGQPNLEWARYFEATYEYVFGWPDRELFVRVVDGDFVETLTTDQFAGLLAEEHGEAELEQLHNDLQFATGESDALDG